MQKPKLSIDSQIVHMRDEKGILFNIVDEGTAREFLRQNNYYFKLKSYAKNYEKYTAGPNQGKYINLEFAYLQELSIIDMHLRKLFFQMTIDIEHYLKTQLLRDFGENINEDGYNIINLFFSKNTEVLNRIVTKQKSSYCHDLIKKYQDDFALWNIVEVLTFGDFISLYNLYYTLYPSKNDMSNYLFAVKQLRNATAHNNCLINTLKKSYGKSITPNREVIRYIAGVPNVGSMLRRNKMSNAVVHDIVATLHVFNLVVTSEMVKTYTLKTLRNLVRVRMARHRDYFLRNEEIKSSYIFIRKIIDFYYKNRLKY